jgi:polysaccharide biosynthesis transport protein
VNSENVQRIGPRRPASPVGEPPAGSIKVADLAYAFFRHKYVVIACSVLGVAAAAAYWFLVKPTYISEAKLLIRYVLESGSMPVDPMDQVRTPDTKGESVINSEIELLTSFDLADQVATAIGATNILKELSGGNNESDAAVAVANNLLINQTKKSGKKVELPVKGNVILVSYEHPDPSIARNVLTQLISKYVLLHAKVHRAVDEIAELRRQADEKRTAVENAESQLRKLKNDLQINVVAEAEHEASSLVASLNSQLLATRASLEEYRALAAEGTNQAAASPAATNAVAAVSGNGSDATNSVVLTQPSFDQRREFLGVLDSLDNLRRKEQNLLLQFNPSSTYVKIADAQVQAMAKKRDQMIELNPALTNLTLVNGSFAYTSNTPATPSNPAEAIRLGLVDRNGMTFKANLASLEAKEKLLAEQLKTARDEARKLADAAPEIAKLERKLEIDGKQYTYFSSAVEKASADSVLAGSRLGNISLIQQPSPPHLNTAKKLKVTAGLGFGGIALGIGWAVLVEMFLDSSLRRPGQIADKLGLRLFLSIPRLPRLSAGGMAAARPLLGAPAGANSGKEGSTDAKEAGASVPAPPGVPDEMAGYAEALRDRLIMHFQARDLHHKPKLIGVTSFASGAGVTSVATSLAAALSETGEGNVLYVDVNPRQGPSVHPFQHGKSVAGVTEALGEGSREQAQVNEHLFAVSVIPENGGKIGVLPRTLAGLVPKMKASVYDYIIFDLPPVTQTSLTMRVAGLLDMNLVVIESEKTHTGLAEQAANLLAESNSEMVAVLNKHRRYLPRKLDGDL